MRNQHFGQLLLLLLTTSLSVLAMTTSSIAMRKPLPPAQDGERSARQGRLRPPTGLSCEVNHTTSFTGRITSYSRTARRIFIRVRTDEQTTEQFTIQLRRGEDASKKFLFEGEAFQPDDWKKIERVRGRLKSGMRATIWACRDDDDDFHAELIDWRPNENGGSFVL